VGGRLAEFDGGGLCWGYRSACRTHATASPDTRRSRFVRRSTVSIEPATQNPRVRSAEVAQRRRTLVTALGYPLCGLMCVSPSLVPSVIDCEPQVAIARGDEDHRATAAKRALAQSSKFRFPLRRQPHVVEADGLRVGGSQSVGRCRRVSGKRSRAFGPAIPISVSDRVRLDAGCPGRNGKLGEDRLVPLGVLVLIRGSDGASRRNGRGDHEQQRAELSRQPPERVWRQRNVHSSSIVRSPVGLDRRERRTDAGRTLGAVHDHGKDVRALAPTS
jgi:hypothetical protein